VGSAAVDTQQSSVDTYSTTAHMPFALEKGFVLRYRGPVVWTLVYSPNTLAKFERRKPLTRSTSWLGMGQLRRGSLDVSLVAVEDRYLVANLGRPFHPYRPAHLFQQLQVGLGAAAKQNVRYLFRSSSFESPFSPTDAFVREFNFSAFARDGLKSSVTVNVSWRIVQFTSGWHKR
jgi:hypothetical protein